EYLQVDPREGAGVAHFVAEFRAIHFLQVLNDQHRLVPHRFHPSCLCRFSLLLSRRKIARCWAQALSEGRFLAKGCMATGKQFFPRTPPAAPTDLGWEI